MYGSTYGSPPLRAHPQEARPGPFCIRNSQPTGRFELPASGLRNARTRQFEYRPVSFRIRVSQVHVVQSHPVPPPWGYTEGYRGVSWRQPPDRTQSGPGMLVAGSSSRGGREVLVCGGDQRPVRRAPLQRFRLPSPDGMIAGPTVSGVTDGYVGGRRPLPAPGRRGGGDPDIATVPPSVGRRIRPFPAPPPSPRERDALAVMTPSVARRLQGGRRHLGEPCVRGRPQPS